MNRRRFLRLAGYGTAAFALAGSGTGAWWLTGAKPEVHTFANIASARRWLETLAREVDARSLTEWPLPRVLEHCAQSIEFSLHGFPQAEPEWFQASVGALAFAVFNRRGRMRHSLVEPIPGAPELLSVDLAHSVQRLDRAFIDFEAHQGALMPHFAYGPLNKARYTRAHLMHLANHAEEIALG